MSRIVLPSIRSGSAMFDADSNDAAAGSSATAGTNNDVTTAIDTTPMTTIRPKRRRSETGRGIRAVGVAAAVGGAAEQVLRVPVGGSAVVPRTGRVRADLRGDTSWCRTTERRRCPPQSGPDAGPERPGAASPVAGASDGAHDRHGSRSAGPATSPWSTRWLRRPPGWRCTPWRPRVAPRPATWPASSTPDAAAPRRCLRAPTCSWSRRHPQHHVALALQGLAAGARVLVEKPIATTLAEADRLVAAAGAPGAPTLRCGGEPAARTRLARTAAPTPRTRHAPATCRCAPCSRHRTGATSPGHSPIGGVLFDLGPHPIALALGVAGEPPVGVSATLSLVPRRRCRRRCRGRAPLRVGAPGHGPRVVDVARRRLGPPGCVGHRRAAPRAAARGACSSTTASRCRYRRATGCPIPASSSSATSTSCSTWRTTTRPGRTRTQAREVLEVICAAYASAGRRRGGRRAALRR